MTDTSDSIECIGCGKQLNESDAVCPDCGDTRRVISVSITEKVTIYEGLGVKGKRPSQKKPFIEEKAGPSFSHSRQKHVHRVMTIDRDNDRYMEKVTDYQSEEVIHHCDEPLSKHRGHGSAKGRKPKP